MIAVIDYGAGNIRSVLNALEELGEDAVVIDAPEALRDPARIILPGVGAMAPAMARLRERGLDAALTEAVLERGVPFLGICLGMQLMCTIGHEGGETVRGLGWVDGDVVALEPAPPARLVPHTGWAEVVCDPDDPLFQGLRPGTAFYFCHSFHARVADPDHCGASIDFGEPVTVGLRCGAALGVQFHPERSGNAGLRLIENFLEWEGPAAAQEQQRRAGAGHG